MEEYKHKPLIKNLLTEVAIEGWLSLTLHDFRKPHALLDAESLLKVASITEPPYLLLSCFCCLHYALSIWTWHLL